MEWMGWVITIGHLWSVRRWSKIGMLPTIDMCNIYCTYLLIAIEGEDSLFLPWKYSVYSFAVFLLDAFCTETTNVLSALETWTFEINPDWSILGILRFISCTTYWGGPTIKKDVGLSWTGGKWGRGGRRGGGSSSQSLPLRTFSLFFKVRCRLSH